MAPTTDIAIIGGGPSGLALAGILQHTNITYIIFERSASDTPPQGGCLDLHQGSGQLAMQEAGCYEKFRSHGRVGDATIHQVWDHEGNKVFNWGDGEDEPEMDREEIKQSLLTTIPEDKIQWEMKVVSAERNGEGVIVLKFEDGTEATGFKLIVGADGANSHIRHLVTPAKPKYSGIAFWTGKIHPTNPFYATVEEMAGHGPMIVMGRSTMIWNQRQGDGHYRLDLGFKRPEDFIRTRSVDLSDTEATKKFVLSEFYPEHAEKIRKMIQAIDTGFHPWPLYYMPPESLKWKPQQDVTLIGDAAHVTTPFVGEGVNMAMLDSVILVRKLREFGISRQAIGEYEKDMFERAGDVIRRSVESGKLYYDWNAPKTVMDANVHNAKS